MFKFFTGKTSNINSGLQYSLPLTAYGTVLTTNQTTRAILLEVAGSVEIEYSNGLTDTIPLTANTLHPILGFTKILSSSLVSTSQIHIGY